MWNHWYAQVCVQINYYNQHILWSCRQHIGCYPVKLHWEHYLAHMQQSVINVSPLNTAIKHAMLMWRRNVKYICIDKRTSVLEKKKRLINLSKTRNTYDDRAVKMVTLALYIFLLNFDFGNRLNYKWFSLWRIVSLKYGFQYNTLK